jgi:hypothetical protein
MIRLHPVPRVRIRWMGAVLMSLLLTSVLLVSVGYVLLEQHHACTGEHCPICTNVSNCVAALRTEGSGVLLVKAPKLTAIQPALRSLVSHRARLAADSPVSRKVKLSD